MTLRKLLSMVKESRMQEKFSSHIKDKRKMKDNVGPLLNEVGTLLTEDIEKVELVNIFLSQFTDKTSPEDQNKQMVEGKLSLGQGGLG